MTYSQCDVIIIGAGISGLTCGSYLSHEAKQVLIIAESIQMQLNKAETHFIHTMKFAKEMDHL